MAVWEVCAACGGLVADVDAHVTWHQQLVTLAPVIPSTPTLDLPKRHTERNT